MSLEELKCAAAEIKSLKPVQEALVSFFKASSWEEIDSQFGSSVTPEKLMKFAVSEYTIDQWNWYYM